MERSDMRKGQLIAFEYSKPNSHSHREGTIESINNQKNIVTIRVSTLPLEFKSFKMTQMTNLRILH
jgi:hypothetical protein